jgi:hypothetical protein
MQYENYAGHLSNPGEDHWKARCAAYLTDLGNKAFCLRKPRVLQTKMTGEVIQVELTLNQLDIKETANCIIGQLRGRISSIK